MRYKEIKYQIETLIASMRPDEPLPSRDALCHMLMTTRATLHKAIQELVQENKLYTRGGSGTYVAGDEPQQENTIRFIGLIVPNNITDGYRNLVSGVESYLREYNINLVLYCTDGNADKQDACITRLIQSGITGVVMAPAYSMDITRDYVLYTRLKQHNVSLVCCYRGLAGVPNVPTVGNNDFYWGCMATKHLISKGYRHITYIAQFLLRTTLDRYQGYIAAMVEAGLEIRRDEVVLEVAQNSDSPEGYQETLALLRNNPEIDAIFCNSDRFAGSVYQAIRDCGKKVSDDIGVISIDNFEKECLLMKPQLSSIGGHPFEIGRKAAQILLDEMNHKPGKALLFFYLPVLFDRDSCRGPKPSNT